MFYAHNSQINYSTNTKEIAQKSDFFAFWSTPS